MTVFQSEIFQNPYLPSGATQVNAIMTVTMTDDDRPNGLQDGPPESPATRLVFGLICDISGSMQGQKLVAAKQGMIQAINLLPESASFFIVTGNHEAKLLMPLSPATDRYKTAAIAAIRDVRASGGTVLSTWLAIARQQFLFQARETVAGPRADQSSIVCQALLLTDGYNAAADAEPLQALLHQCEGLFQCDCRGIGSDWQVRELQRIGHQLLGSTDIIPDASQLEADFQAILKQAVDKSLSSVNLRLWVPIGSRILYCKQVSPSLVDLTDKASPVNEQTNDYPTGAWGSSESRDYHLCIDVPVGQVGDERLAGRASLAYRLNGSETKTAEAKLLAIWTEDEWASAKIDRRVAHYSGQAELAQSIQDGLEARDRGDVAEATRKLGRAVKLAHDSGNEATAKLLRKVVQVEDEAAGTVRLRQDVAKADAMALETRSTKTSRISRQPTGLT